MATAWTRLVRNGTPLVERIRGDRQHFLVTFLWRPGHRVREASLYSTVASADESHDWREGMRLEPLGRHGIWFRSFRLSRRIRATYGLAPKAIPDPKEPIRAWYRYLRAVRPDPENPRQWGFLKDPDVPEDVPVTLSLLELPGAPRQRWVHARGPPRWSEDVHRFRSRFLRNERTVWIAAPPGLRSRETRCNLVVMLDGFTYHTTVPAPRILENLVAARKIAPTVLVLVGNVSGRRETELAGHPAFADFLARELIPWVRRRYALRVDPGRTVLAGSSLGGLTSAYTAFRYPRVVGNVLAQSGSFQWPIRGHRNEEGGLTRQFVRAPRLPLKFYLDAGTLESSGTPGGGLSLLAGVRHLRDVLEARGYPVRYAEFDGGHDYACWQGTLADGLVFLLGRDPPSGSPR